MISLFYLYILGLQLFIYIQASYDKGVLIKREMFLNFRCLHLFLVLLDKKFFVSQLPKRRLINFLFVPYFLTGGPSITLLTWEKFRSNEQAGAKVWSYTSRLNLKSIFSFLDKDVAFHLNNNREFTSCTEGDFVRSFDKFDPVYVVNVFSLFRFTQECFVPIQIWLNLAQ